MAGYQLGRLGRLLVAEEATYGVAPTLLATMAMRHLNFVPTYNPKNRVMSEEKRQTPGYGARFDRRTTAGWNLSSAYLRPSGVIKTIPECSKILEHGLGSVVVGSLTTTVAAAPAPTPTVFTLASAVGLTVGEFVLINLAAGASPGKYARMVTNISTAEITVSPALPYAPTTGDTVKTGVTYKLATDPAKSLSFARYLPDISFLLTGGVVNELTVTLNNNEEVQFSATGPAKEQVQPAPAIPGFTTVGGNPPSGLVGGLHLNGTAYPFLTGEIALVNTLELQNEEYGTSKAKGFFRNGFREVTFSLEARVTDAMTVYALAELVSNFELFVQTGATEGNIVAVRAPKCEFEQVPDTPDDNTALAWSYAGVCLETTGNDEFSIGLL